MWRDLVTTLLEHLQQHWYKYAAAVGMTGVGWLFGKWRERRNWQRKEFLGRINFSLNSVQPIERDEHGPSRYSLKIRTLAELGLRDAFLNDTAASVVSRAAQRTTPENPILELPRDDSWYFLNAILNELSERYSLGFLLMDNGKPVTLQKYLICLTSEAAGLARTRKVRAMVIREDALRQVDWNKPFTLESDNHATRVKTLKLLSETYKSEPWRFLSLELPIPGVLEPAIQSAAV